MYLIVDRLSGIGWHEIICKGDTVVTTRAEQAIARTDQQQQVPIRKKPNKQCCWAQVTIKGEINETKPTICIAIYLH